MIPFRQLSVPGQVRVLLLCVVCCSLGFLNVVGQDAIVPMGGLSERALVRLQIKYDSLDTVHSAIKPYRRGDVFDAVVQYSATLSSRTGTYDTRYLLSDNDEFFTALANDSIQPSRPELPLSKRPVLGVFYTRPAHLYAYDSEDFYVRVNPILHFGLGQESGRDGVLFVNRRGIAIRGGVDQKVFFSTDIIEAQVRPASYIREFVETYRALPDAGLFKEFNSRIFESEGAYDYLTSSGYLGFNVSRHVGLQFGHGKNFIGDGYRSLFLSDFSKNYFYLKLNTRVWKFHYQNIFAELGAREKLPGNVVVPKKYLAAHYLSVMIKSNISIGLYEAVVFARDVNKFEFQYLNPVILYRSIEHHVGSPDNVLLGLSGRWDVQNKFRLYGQFIVDEFKFDEIFSSRGWWGNKNGIQLGALYPDALGIETFDVQCEYNRVRPFTYSHYDTLGSYSHFNQALAHPVGANFNEVLFNLQYRPIPQLWLNGKLFVINSGNDTQETYYGSDILRSNDERNAEYGVHQLQGVRGQTLLWSLRASYMLKYNLFLEATYFRRDFTSDITTDDLLSSYFMLGVRWNYEPSQDEF